jgi:hypothetical protein
MPKRLSDAEMDAAAAAGRPPQSTDCLDDAAWRGAQNRWLQSWQPAESLPPPDDQNRRKKWQKLTQLHGRHFQAAGTRADSRPSSALLAFSTEEPAFSDREWLEALRQRCRQLAIDSWSISDTIGTLETKVMQRNMMPPAPVMAVPEAPLPPSSMIDAAPPDAAPPDEESMRERRLRLRAECLAVGIEYSISDSADELEDALRKTHAAVGV